ncbi:MAG: M23 family metallopeptidase [Candidatus Latescibacterota bacterium]|jgi:hypothetical protein
MTAGCDLAVAAGSPVNKSLCLARPEAADPGIRVRSFAGLLLIVAVLSALPARAAVSGAVLPDSFGWPIDHPRVLSSTFGETRAAAFHAGIDLKTAGRTGFVVRALADGSVVRLRTSPWGYGRVVYQQLADGRTLVYAHLQRFAPALAARVDSAQQARGRYTVDLTLTPGEVPVHQGEVIAWSGDSGTGPPHLHLELRDPANQPINPLLHGFVVPDSVAPVLERLAAIPLDRASLVEDRHHPVAVPLAGDRPARIRAEGRVGIALQVHDLGSQAPNPLAPHRTALRVDGEPVFAAAYERFSYEETHLVRLDRIRVPVADGTAEFFALFRQPGNRLGFYNTGPDQGILTLGPGIHQVEVEATDAAGNRSVGKAELLVDAAPRLEGVRLSDDGTALVAEVIDPDDTEVEVEVARLEGERWESIGQERGATGSRRWPLQPGETGVWRVRVVDATGAEGWATCGRQASAAGSPSDQPRLTLSRATYPEFVEVTVSSDRMLAEAPAITAGGASLPVRQTGMREYLVDVPLRVGGADRLEVRLLALGLHGTATEERILLDQRPVIPGAATRWTFAPGAAELVFSANSAYAPLFPQGDSFSPSVPSYLEPFGPGYAFSPAGVPFDDRVEVRLPYPTGYEEPGRLGVYLEGEEGQWSMAGNRLDTTACQVVARVRTLGRFAVLADHEPPRITEVRPEPGAVLKERRPLLSAAIGDRGSGIGDEEEIVLELDGRRLISEYDPDAGIVRYPIRHDLRPGKHVLVVRVGDQAGNRTTARSEFTVR